MTTCPRELRAFDGADGVRLRGDAYGHPTDPPVLLLHGGGQTRGAWGSTAAQMAGRGYYAVSIDHRGHGESDWSPAGDYGSGTLAEDVRRVAAELGRPPVAGGASLGGFAALLAEGETPRQVLAGLVLVDVAPRLELEGVQRILAFMRARPEGYASVEEAADAVAAYLPNRPRPSDLSGLERNLRRTPEGRWVWHWDPRFLEHATTVGVAERQHQRFETAAARLEVPTLLVRGRMSEVVSEEGVREFLETVPHAEYVDVAQAGHMVAGDHNDAFTDAVIAFLDRHRPA